MNLSYMHQCRFLQKFLVISPSVGPKGRGAAPSALGGGAGGGLLLLRSRESRYDGQASTRTAQSSRLTYPQLVTTVTDFGRFSHQNPLCMQHYQGHIAD